MSTCLKRVIFLTLILNIYFIHLKAQVKIGDNPTTINGASLLELEATDKGLVLPRISIPDANASSPLSSGILTGTIVYNTNSSTIGGSGTGLYFWNGSKWIYITNSASALTNSLSLSGNTLTSTVNGVAATSNAVSNVSNTSSANTINTTVNGVAGATVNIINSNTNTWTQAGGLATAVNGVSSTITPSSGTVTNVLGYNSTGSPVYQSATNVVTNAISHSLSFSGNTLTSTVNGISATSSTVGSVSNTSSANTIKTTVNGVAGSTVNIINSNTNGLTQSGGLVNTVNGVAATTSIASGDITNTLGFNTAGNAVYKPITDFYAANTGTYTSITANNTPATDPNLTVLVNKGGGTFNASTCTYTIPSDGIYEVETQLRYHYNSPTNVTTAMYFARLIINGTIYQTALGVPYTLTGSLAGTIYTVYEKQIISLSAGVTISSLSTTFYNGSLFLDQFRIETFHIKKVD